MLQVKASLPQPIYDLLLQEVAHRGITISQIVREAIEDRYKEYHKFVPNPAQSRPKTQPSPNDLDGPEGQAALDKLFDRPDQ